LGGTVADDATVMPCLGVALTDRGTVGTLAEGLGELATLCEALVGVLGQRCRHGVIEACEIRSAITEFGWLGSEVLADDCDTVGTLIWRRAGEQMKCGGGQRVLVCAAIDI
jgi:hypothetical protein